VAGRSATAREDIATLRTIGEVAENLDLPQHVLRFWETRFKEIDPLKRAGGRRFYRPRDIELVESIRHLLYREGYTIKGVQRILKEQGVDAVIADVRRRQSGEAAEAARQEAPRPDPPTTEPPTTELHRREPTLGQTILDLPEPPPPRFEPEAPSIAPPVEAQPVAERVAPIDPPQAAAPAPMIPAAPVVQPPVLAHPPVIVTRRLDQEQAILLRQVLAELEECKRLLNLTRR
jgi:DNA-binding transcriptional MerR regulator